MSTDTPPLPPASDLEGLDEREVWFNAYIDGELTDEQREAFDRRLEDDPEFRADYDEFADLVDGVQNLPYEFAPDDFSERLQRRMRTQSHGRLFGDNVLYRQRIPYEAIAIVMILVMASTYLLLGMPPDRPMQESADKELEIPPKRSSAPADQPRR